MQFPLSSIERLFHGSLETLVGDLRPGNYDGVFWTAESSCIAQAYIPRTGGSIYCSMVSYELDRVVRPSKTDPCYLIAKHLGRCANDVEWDQYGSAQSWRIPDGAMTYREVSQYIEEVLGYQNKAQGGDPLYELRQDGFDPGTNESVFVEASYRKPGSLVIVEGFQDLRLFSMSTGEGDLTALQYHDVGRFKKLADEGYDGVVIDDFVQSKAWGNVGHRSIGFFAHAMPRLKTEIIGAASFDWDYSPKALQRQDTDEYLAWKALRSIQSASAKPPAALAAG